MKVEYQHSPLVQIRHPLPGNGGPTIEFMGLHQINSHKVSTWVEPFAVLNLPSSDQDESLHGQTRLLSASYNNRSVIVLTEIGRNILCAHIRGSLPQTCLSPDLVTALSVNSVVNPPTSLNSWGFHFLNLLWNFRGIALRRSDLNSLKAALGDSFRNHPHPEWFPKQSEDDDIIQSVNKTSQWGLAHNSERLKTPSGEMVYYYWIAQPLVFVTPTALRKPTVPQNFITQIPSCNCDPSLIKSSTFSERDLAIERLRINQFLIDNFINVPLSEWTIEGHKDAQNKDRGTVAQPKKFNRAARDRWKFDDNGMTRCPSIGNLSTNLRDFYPSDTELTQLLSAIQNELGITPTSEKSDS